MSKHPKKWRVVAIIGAFAATVFAATYTVPQGINIPVHEKRGSMWPVVGTLTAGQSAEVVREDGEWLIVRINGKEGTVKKTAFDAPKTMLTGAALGAQANAADASAAGRGIDKVTYAYAAGKGLSMAPLERLQDNRLRVVGTKWVGFASSKSVGTYKK